jgi:hypothetical protein
MIRELDCSRAFFGSPKRAHTYSRSKVESHYKPFPRKMHQAFWPTRSSNRGLSEDVLQAVEKTSPASAAVLRIRARPLSPSSRSRSSSMETTTAAAVAGARAVSEPPDVRKHSTGPKGLRESSRVQGTEMLRTTRATLKSRSPSSSADMPQPLTGLRLEGHRDPPRPPALFNAGTACSSEVVSESDTGAGVGDDESPPPLPDTFKGLESAHDSWGWKEGATEIGNSSPGSPSRTRNLKRKGSTTSAHQVSKRHRNTSVFDLVEEQSRPARNSVFELSEGSPNALPRLPRTSIAHRPKVARSTMTRRPSESLYLPR